MKRRWLTWSALLALVAAVTVLAACGGDDDGGAADTSGGGGGSDDINAVVEQLGGPVEFGTPRQGRHLPDREHRLRALRRLRPDGRVLRHALEDLLDLMLRPLLSYNFTSRATAGNELVADLATEVPEPSDGRPRPTPSR